MTQKIAFLDRDGTINIDYGYVTQPAKVKLIENAALAISELRSKGFKVVIVTNQSAISRGMASRQEVELTNQEVLKQLSLEDANAIVDQVLYSPAKPEDNDDTRKPKIGMLRGIDYDKSESLMVGDKMSDVEFGINAGLKKENCFLLSLSKEKQEYQFCAKDLLHVVEIISSRVSSRNLSK